MMVSHFLKLLLLAQNGFAVCRGDAKASYSDSLVMFQQSAVKYGLDSMKQRSKVGDVKHKGLIPPGSRQWEKMTNDDKDPPRQPHIVFVLADDLGWHDVGYSGGDIPTPNIDALASEGITLTNYYVQPTCAPTRASLMTGVGPFRHGVIVPYSNANKFGLPTSWATMADVLGNAGYETHMVGKWHLGFWKEDYTPTFRGFSSFFGFYGAMEDYWTHSQEGYDFRREEGVRCGKGCSIPEDVRGKYGTSVLNQRAREVVQQHDTTKPLFLYFAWQAVHCPANHCPGNFSYNGTRSAKFACMLMMADEGLGDLVKALETKKMLQDTILIFSTDNGGPISSWERLGDDIGSSNWPLRGGKHTLFEGGTRATSFVWMGWRRPRSSYNGLMGVSDWLPTLATLANAKLPDTLDGKDQWAAMSMQTKSPHHHLVTGMTPGEDVNHFHWSVRIGKWKLIKGTPGWYSQGWSGPTGSNISDCTDRIFLPTTLLYDLDNDESERNDLSKQHPEKLQQLLHILLPYEDQSLKVNLSHVSQGKFEPSKWVAGNLWAPAE